MTNTIDKYDDWFFLMLDELIAFLCGQERTKIWRIIHSLAEFGFEPSVRVHDLFGANLTSLDNTSPGFRIITLSMKIDHMRRRRGRKSNAFGAVLKSSDGPYDDGTGKKMKGPRSPLQTQLNQKGVAAVLGLSYSETQKRRASGELTDKDLGCVYDGNRHPKYDTEKVLQKALKYETEYHTKAPQRDQA